MAIEAYHCFAYCYANDKGLAMNLGRPSSLPESILEFDILKPPISIVSPIEHFLLCIALSQLQSYIITYLRSPASRPKHDAYIPVLLAKSDALWGTVQDVCNDCAPSDNRKLLLLTS